MLTDELKTIGTRIQSGKNKREMITKKIEDNKSEVIRLNSRAETILKAQSLVQLSAQEVQNRIRVCISDIVQSAIEAPFQGEYDFYLEFEPKAGKTEARIFLQDAFGNEVSPKDDNGGGLVDIVSFALRIAAWSLDLRINGIDSVMILDEPFKFLSAGIRPLGAEMLKRLAKELQLQLIMVTHDSIFMDIGDRIFTVTKDQKTKRSHITVQEAVNE